MFNLLMRVTVDVNVLLLHFTSMKNCRVLFLGNFKIFKFKISCSTQKN